MQIYNTTDLLCDYINWLEFATIYKEDTLDLPIKANISLPVCDAPDYLVSSAYAGNKVAGFFQKLPDIDTSKPLRGTCLLISFSLPPKIQIPTFFCRQPDDIPGLFCIAVKLSADISMPVSVIISANALNNYTSSAMPIEKLNRAAPYLSKTESVWSNHTYAEKLRQGIDTVISYMELNGHDTALTDELCFSDTSAYFPPFIFPVKYDKQTRMFKKIRTLKCSREEEAFFRNIVESYLQTDGVNDIQITPSYIPGSPDPGVAPVMCPGCPFITIGQIYKDTELIMYTSVNCPSVDKLFAPVKTSYAGYLGLVDKKVNITTLFIGNISSMYLDFSPENSIRVALNDTGGKYKLPILKAGSKPKQNTIWLFPYSCNNISKIGSIKYRMKKCTCIKDGIEPQCIAKTSCYAISRHESGVHPDTSSCSGCRACVYVCPSKALV